MKKIVKHIIAAFVILSWAFPFVMIFSELSPNSNIKLFQFVLMKLGGCVLAYFLFKSTVFCYNQGFFPEFVHSLIKKIEEV